MRRGRIADHLDPVSEPDTLDQFWQLVVAVDAAPILWAPSTSLKTMASAVLFDRQPFDRTVRCRTKKTKIRPASSYCSTALRRSAPHRGQIEALSLLRLSRRLRFRRHHRRVPLSGQSIALRCIEPHREVERPLRCRQPVRLVVGAGGGVLEVEVKGAVRACRCGRGRTGR